MLSSCVDTELLPYNKTVDEDFWQTKGDVSSMVNGAYKSMLSAVVISRLIVWGDFRSDELVLVNSISNSTTEALNEIYAANLQITNTYANWASLYSVINICNIVLEKSQAVINIDPSYTEGDWKSDCAQMKALRSLCYFYLVRNFRDVPYSSKAYMNSSQDLRLAQSSPDSVLTCCINDLKEAEADIISAEAYSDWRRVGWFNKDGVDALLADIYLWRASIMDSSSDYEQAVFYSNKVIESKKAQHQTRRLQMRNRNILSLQETKPTPACSSIRMRRKASSNCNSTVRTTATPHFANTIINMLVTIPPTAIFVQHPSLECAEITWCMRRTATTAS